MTREEAEACIDKLYVVADEIIELMRENGITYWDAGVVLERIKKRIDDKMSNTKI